MSHMYMFHVVCQLVLVSTQFWGKTPVTLRTERDHTHLRSDINFQCQQVSDPLTQGSHVVNNNHSQLNESFFFPTATKVKGPILPR